MSGTALLRSGPMLTRVWRAPPLPKPRRTSVPDDSSARALGFRDGWMNAVLQSHNSRPCSLRPTLPPPSPKPSSLRDIIVYDEKWYYGNISREKAERLVLDQEKGTFLVRVSIKKKKKNCKQLVSRAPSPPLLMSSLPAGDRTAPIDNPRLIAHSLAHPPHPPPGHRTQMPSPWPWGTQTFSTSPSP